MRSRMLHQWCCHAWQPTMASVLLTFPPWLNIFPVRPNWRSWVINILAEIIQVACSLKYAMLPPCLVRSAFVLHISFYPKYGHMQRTTNLTWPCWDVFKKLLSCSCSRCLDISAVRINPDYDGFIKRHQAMNMSWYLKLVGGLLGIIIPTD